MLYAVTPMKVWLKREDARNSRKKRDISQLLKAQFINSEMMAIQL